MPLDLTCQTSIKVAMMDKGGDEEAIDLFMGLPHSGPHGSEATKPLNARCSIIVRAGRPFLEVWLNDGGWLGIYLENILGDVAPFAG